MSGGGLWTSGWEFLDVGRQGDADRLKQLAGDAGGRGAQQEALAVLFEGDFLQPVEIAQNVVPFSGEAVAAQPIFKFLGEQQGQEGAEHMAANGHVAAVVDRPGGEHGLGPTWTVGADFAVESGRKACGRGSRLEGAVLNYRGKQHMLVDLLRNLMMLKSCLFATSASAATPRSIWSRTCARAAAPNSASSPISAARKRSSRMATSTAWRARSRGWRSARWCCRSTRARRRPMRRAGGSARLCCSTGCGKRPAAGRC